jgi:hypothetical protein
MTTRDPVAGFFDELGARGHEPLLDAATCKVRFDVVDGRRTERWTLTVTKGDLAVSRAAGASDLVIRGERPLLERLVRGEANAMAALLRGELTLDGTSELIVLVQRLFPRPRRTRAASRARRRK